VPGPRAILRGMQHVHLGRSGLRVSRLCLGTMNFGPRTSPEDSHAILDHALEAGIDFVDTANVYGKKKGEGVTERIIGDWIAQGGGRRERIVLATKVYGAMGDGPNDGKLSAYHIRSACEASLRRLRTDHIDLYQMHHVWREAPLDEVWQAFELLVQQGKVLYVGSSNFAGWHIARACESARSRHFLGLVSEQGLYNLTERSVELEVLPACEAYGLGFLPWSPLAGGVLAGAVAEADVGRRAAEDVKERAVRQSERLAGFAGVCRELGEEPAAVALAWLLARPGVTAPIVGPRTIAQLDGALHALEVRLGPETLARLDALFPGPGGPAPEAWAW
jgi:aryl-alcohol dehydrogenase-like predicted oxidoreductase